MNASRALVGFPAWLCIRNVFSKDPGTCFSGLGASLAGAWGIQFSFPSELKLTAIPNSKEVKIKKLRQKCPEHVMANRLTLVACRIQTAIVVALGPSSTSS